MYVSSIGKTEQKLKIINLESRRLFNPCTRVASGREMAKYVILGFSHSPIL